MNLRLLYLTAAVTMIGLSVGCLYPEPGHRHDGRRDQRQEYRHEDRRDRDQDDRRGHLPGQAQ